MGTSMSVIKTLIIPAVISLIIFLVSTYLLIPLWRRYRNRYSQYLPLESISNGTSSLRARVQNGIAGLMVPSTWRQRLQDRLVVADSNEDADYDSEDGEELGVVDEPTRRGVLGRSQQHSVDDTRRLSRDLEEGFRDDSDEDGSSDSDRR
ncbi:hypothetical protein B0H66DRAFT_599797 [Apodospora peruviana]|uniref:Uncharacterized protein n=1 Tax=Apodospora peruviana TaxID=516989 RepID=A0AAE0IIL0_9PEZI|nr:hypothetical protein B0H66DRAFT_599797 [Apodospora peruviana]